MKVSLPAALRVTACSYAFTMTRICTEHVGGYPQAERGNAMTDDTSTTFEFDIALSFAGENRAYVADVAERLRSQDIRVFYDQYEQATLWGKNLYDRLDYVYRRAARYCILFISKQYADKVWTNHERQSAQARALDENQEY